MHVVQPPADLDIFRKKEKNYGWIFILFLYLLPPVKAVFHNLCSAAASVFVECYAAHSFTMYVWTSPNDNYPQPQPKVSFYTCHVLRAIDDIYLALCLDSGVGQ